MREIINDYEQLDLRELDIITITDLYSLEPQGLNSPLVESLTSYIMRLSEVHSVSVGRLINIIYAAHLKNRSYVELFGKAQFSSDSYINSTGNIAEDFVGVTAKLTGITEMELRQLTLLNWSGIRVRNFMRETRAWCPECLQEMKTNGGIYEPLIWNIKSIKICFKHNLQLEELCPSCNSKVNTLRSFSRVGHCSKCNNFLGKSIMRNPEFNDNDVLWEQWKCHTIAHMILNYKVVDDYLTPTQITELIRNIINHSTGGNKAEFSRKFDINRNSTEFWCRGTHIPDFNRLLQFSYYYKVHLLEMIINFPWQQKEFNKEAYQHVTKRRFMQVNPEEVRLYLREIIERDDYPPLSLSQVINQNRYLESVLYYNAREECEIITRKYKEYLSLRKKERIENVYNEIEKVILYLYENKLSLSDRKIISLLTCKTHFSELYKLRDQVFLKYKIER
jgi:hypothetical protein